MTDLPERLTRAAEVAITETRSLMLEARERIESLTKALAVARGEPVDHCEHGVKDGEWCEPCNREYKASRVPGRAVGCGRGER